MTDSKPGLGEWFLTAPPEDVIMALVEDGSVLWSIRAAVVIERNRALADAVNERHLKEHAESALAALTTERDVSRQALEDDAADLWRVTNAIKDVIANRSWVTEGRGSYKWDDDRYRDEARLAFDEVRKLIVGVQHPAQRRFHEIVGHEPSPMGKLRAQLAAMTTARDEALAQPAHATAQCSHGWVVDWERHEAVGRICVHCGKKEGKPRDEARKERDELKLKRATTQQAEGSLGAIWHELSFGARHRLMRDDHGLDPIILTLRGSDAEVSRLTAQLQEAQQELAKANVREADARRDHQRAMERAEAAESQLTALRGALDTAVKVAEDAYRAWDSDSDSRVGKLIGALAVGRATGYRADIDAFHAVRAEAALSASPLPQQTTTNDDAATRSAESIKPRSRPV